MGLVKRKLNDEDDDPSWTGDKKRGAKNKKVEKTMDRQTEFFSPYRKPLAQCSLTSVEENGQAPSSHVTIAIR